MEPIVTVDSGPCRVSRSTVVDAAPNELFVILANPHRHHEVDGSGTVRPEVIGPRELQHGDRFRVAMRMLGIPYGITSTVTRLEPDRVIEWRHPGGHSWRWEFDPAGGGRTRVTETFDYGASRLAPVLPYIKAPERNAEAIEKSLRRLQQRFATA